MPGSKNTQLAWAAGGHFWGTHPQVSACLLEVVSFFCFWFSFCWKNPLWRFWQLQERRPQHSRDLKPPGNKGDTPGSSGFLQSDGQSSSSCTTHQIAPKMQTCINNYLLLSINVCIFFKYDTLHFLSPYFNKAKLFYVNGSSKNVKNYLLLLWLQIDSQISGTQREKTVNIFARYSMILGLDLDCI